MADLKDNLWKALDDLRDSPEDPLDFDQIQKAVDEWKSIRQELEFEDAINNAVEQVSEAFYYAVHDSGMKDEKQLVLARNNAMDCVREAVKNVMNPAPAGKHSKNVTTEQNKPDGEATVRTYAFNPKDGFTEVAFSSNVRQEVFDAIKDLFNIDFNK